jgi:transposase-like protein
MSERAAPFYCPYCGDEDLEPVTGGTHATGSAWYCRSCARAFALKFLGIGKPSHDDA